LDYEYRVAEVALSPITTNHGSLERRLNDIPMFAEQREDWQGWQWCDSHIVLDSNQPKLVVIFKRQKEGEDQSK
jgi:hypothetical protein